MKNTKLIAVLVFAFLLSSCSSKVAYRYLDFFASVSISDYVSFNREQDALADEKIDQILAWHQATQLNQYSDVIGQFMVDVQDPLSEQVLNKHLDSVYGFGRGLSNKVAPNAALVLSKLTDKQVTQLMESIREKTEERREEYFEPSRAELREERIYRVAGLLENWMGDLSPEQWKVIARWSEQLNDPRDYWLEYKLIWDQRFEQALKNRKGPEFQDEINLLFVNFDQLWPQDYAQAQQNNLQQGIALAIELRASASPKQIAKFTKELGKLRKTFAELAEEAEPYEGQLVVLSDQSEEKSQISTFQ